MPGRYEPISQFIADMTALGIEYMVCLTSDREIRRKSPDYLEAVENVQIKVKRTVLAITDFGTPEDMDAFHVLVRDTARQLQGGKTVLIHCAGGIGRTGTFAGCVLKQLGQSLVALEDSASYPETDEQLALVCNWLAV